ncbi:DNA-protecting protein DprA [Sporosarcina sp. ANT_H38]|uniref:DNA-processing protein DprA n=1 Tax=Sporosarcina sp. ANT_H38 TaxID=2597358 RepID=UPI0011F2C119|nr:DNA-processing protein DprA [Sporosarcina sp. ANT_H38]KAA0966526.1 DNA-protecting protein DprA [Sporosarcina sp. ANT_H38]
MELTDAERRLLALHYVFPVPLNKLNGLYEIDPNLEKLYVYKANELAHILRISVSKAIQIKDNLHRNADTPYDELYERNAITPIPFSNPLYPDQLRILIDPPAVLYAKGDTTLLTKKFNVAIIGSRKATVYSKKAMALIVPPLVENEAVIVSGLATGADTMAHEAALEYGGKTIAVLGHGLFHLYPKENRALAEKIAVNHLLITEYPPYVNPERWTFPMRNRIISGLSDVVVVTESADKSGTMSTVEHALDHGKDIYAVPGPITSLLSAGPNKLIEEGAKPLWNGFQIVGALVFNG